MCVLCTFFAVFSFSAVSLIFGPVQSRSTTGGIENADTNLPNLDQEENFSADYTGGTFGLYHMTTDAFKSKSHTQEDIENATEAINPTTTVPNSSTSTSMPPTTVLSSNDSANSTQPEPILITNIGTQSTSLPETTSTSTSSTTSSLYATSTPESTTTYRQQKTATSTSTTTTTTTSITSQAFADSERRESTEDAFNAPLDNLEHFSWYPLLGEDGEDGVGVTWDDADVGPLFKTTQRVETTTTARQDDFCQYEDDSNYIVDLKACLKYIRDLAMDTELYASQNRRGCNVINSVINFFCFSFFFGKDLRDNCPYKGPMECDNPQIYDFGHSIKSATLDTEYKTSSLENLDRFLFVRYEVPQSKSNVPEL